METRNVSPTVTIMMTIDDDDGDYLEDFTVFSFNFGTTIINHYDCSLNINNKQREKTSI